MGRVKEASEPVPWFLQSSRVLWQEDDALVRDPDADHLHGAWSRLVGGPLPQALSAWDMGDCWLTWGGGRHFWQTACDGQSIEESDGGPSLLELDCATESAARCCRDVFGARIGAMTIAEVRHCVIPELGLDDRAALDAVLRRLAHVHWMRWLGRRQLPEATVVGPCAARMRRPCLRR